jgi:hypothetical protein
VVILWNHIFFWESLNHIYDGDFANLIVSSNKIHFFNS